MSSFSGKVALVTGGARGIGRAIVESFADAGATVAFTYKSSVDAAQQVISELSRRGISVRAYQSDAASFPDTVKIVETLLRDCGRLDILVNNAEGRKARKAGDATLPRKSSKESFGYPYRKPTQVGEEKILRRE